jgi:hypothetical protein
MIRSPRPRRSRRPLVGFDPARLSNNPRQDRRIRNQDTDLAQARCPICRHRLVLRMDCQGPYFFCLCVRPRRAA